MEMRCGTDVKRRRGDFLKKRIRKLHFNCGIIRTAALNHNKSPNKSEESSTFNAFYCQKNFKVNHKFSYFISLNLK